MNGNTANKDIQHTVNLAMSLIIFVVFLGNDTVKFSIIVVGD